MLKKRISLGKPPWKLKGCNNFSDMLCSENLTEVVIFSCCICLGYLLGVCHLLTYRCGELWFQGWSSIRNSESGPNFEPSSKWNNDSVKEGEPFSVYLIWLQFGDITTHLLWRFKTLSSEIASWGYLCNYFKYCNNNWTSLCLGSASSVHWNVLVHKNFSSLFSHL